MSKTRKPTRLATLSVAAAALLLTATACNSGSPDTGDNGADAAAAPAADADSADAGAAGSGEAKIFVVGGKSDDPFWSRVKRGADDAAKVVKAQGGSVTWLAPQNYDNLGPDAAKLIDTAVSQGADGVVGPDWVPEAAGRVLQEGGREAASPLVIYNAGGLEAAENVGALNYIGSDDHDAGKAGGEFFGEQGGQKNVLCVNTLPGAATPRRAARASPRALQGSGGKGAQLPLPSSNFGDPTAVSQAIKAALLKDDSIDARRHDRHAPTRTRPLSAIEQGGVGDKVKLGTFDSTPRSWSASRPASSSSHRPAAVHAGLPGRLDGSTLHPVGDRPAAEAASDGSGDHQRRQRRRRDRRREGRRPLTARCWACLGPSTGSRRPSSDAGPISESGISHGRPSAPGPRPTPAPARRRCLHAIARAT